MAWQAVIADTLTACGVTVAAYVPDTRLQPILARLADNGVRMRSLTREEECIGYAAGQRIAGKRPVVLMQSSGLGNALNAIGSLAVPYRLGLPLVVAMRGNLGEANQNQIPLGRAAMSLLGALGVQSFRVRSPAAAEPVTAGVATLAFDAGECAAIILEAELGGGREGN
jgi:sulfopyruvate decarboxylase alpha subunit